MSIFDIIRYPVTDIRDRTQLDPLPKELLEKWRDRMINYAIEQAESVAHLDESGVSQRCIDATRKYLNDEIDMDALGIVAGDAWDSDVTDFTRAAYWAAHAAYRSNHIGTVVDSVCRAIAWANANSTVGWWGDKGDAEELLHKWLTEEIANHECEQ